MRTVHEVESHAGTKCRDEEGEGNLVEAGRGKELVGPNATIAYRKPLPENPEAVVQIYRSCVRLILERIRRKRKSQRMMAKEVGISPTQLRRMKRNPEKPVSMKTMKKIICALHPALPKTKRRSPRVISNHEYIMVCAK